jgi:hypothetical protein
VKKMAAPCETAIQPNNQLKSTSLLGQQEYWDYYLFRKTDKEENYACVPMLGG